MIPLVALVGEQSYLRGDVNESAIVQGRVASDRRSSHGYSSTSASTRVMRLDRRNAPLWRRPFLFSLMLVRSVKFVVSTTSVLPSLPSAGIAYTGGCRCRDADGRPAE
jgi:hypothetical protein